MADELVVWLAVMVTGLPVTEGLLLGVLTETETDALGACELVTKNVAPPLGTTNVFAPWDDVHVAVPLELVKVKLRPAVVAAVSVVPAVLTQGVAELAASWLYMAKV